MSNDSTLTRHSVDTATTMMIGSFLAGYPKNTRIGYATAIRKFRRYTDAHGLSLFEVQRGHIEAWARHLDEELHLMPKTRACYLTVIRGLYLNAARDGYIDRNPGEFVRRPKVPFVSSTKSLNRTQAHDFVRAAEDYGRMTHVLITMLMFHGLRITECLSINWEHLGAERGFTTLYLPKRKGGKIATMPLAPATSWAIDKLEVPVSDRHGALILGPRGARMNAQHANLTIHRICDQLGIEKKITAHSFRRTFVTMGRDAGINDRDMQNATSHQDPAMLHYYDDGGDALEAAAGLRVSFYIGAAA